MSAIMASYLNFKTSDGIIFNGVVRFGWQIIFNGKMLFSLIRSEVAERGFS
jgi:hypothetical protein